MTLVKYNIKYNPLYLPFMMSKIRSWYPSSWMLIYVTQRMKSGIAEGFSSIKTGMTRSSLSSKLELRTFAIQSGMHSDFDIDIALLDMNITTQAAEVNLSSVSCIFWSGNSTLRTFFCLFSNATLTVRAYLESHLAYNRQASNLLPSSFLGGCGFYIDTDCKT